MNLRIAAVGGLVAMGTTGCLSTHFYGSMKAQCPGGVQAPIDFVWNGNGALPSHRAWEDLGNGEACGCPYQLRFIPNAQASYDVQLYSRGAACGAGLTVAEPDQPPVELKKGASYPCTQSVGSAQSDTSDSTGQAVYTYSLEMTCPGLGDFSAQQIHE